MIALYKTFRGHEWAVASLESIYSHVLKIIYLHSNVGWRGESGNTVAPEIEAWVGAGKDKENKIEQHYLDVSVQAAQYDALNAISKKHNHDWKLLVDTDEVWDDEQMVAAKAHLAAASPKTMAFTCEMDTYLRSPFYRIKPRVLKPTVFVRAESELVGTRACDVRPAGHLPVVMHHFCSVRESLESVWQKHEASCRAEGVACPPMEKWVNEVWNQLPAGRNLLPIKKYEHGWAGVEVVKITNLPAAVRETDIVKSFERYPSARPGARFAAKAPGAQPAAPNNGVLAALPARIVPPKPALKNYDGSLMIFTLVDDAYAPFLPMFETCARRACPDAAVRTVCRAAGDGFPAGGYATAAMRFLVEPEGAREFDYCLITDADIMMYPETTPIVTQHCRSMEKDGTECFENWISGRISGAPRLPGVHFVARSWWERTEKARAEERKKIEDAGAVTDYWYDEVMIGRIVQASGLPLPSVGPKLWRHHGIHLGDWRIHGAHRNWRPVMSPNESLLYRWMMTDEDFQGKLKAAMEKIEYLQKIVKRWPTLFA